MTKPYRFQLQGINLISLRLGRVLLADEMGLGKSLQSLGWGMRKRIKPILVICPASLKWNWSAECLKHFGIHAEILDGRSPPPIRRMRTARVTIINYDILKAWRHHLRKLNPQLVIVDEGQAIKDRGSLRTKMVKLICKRAPYVHILTGTPIVSRTMDLFPSLNILRPDIWPSYFQFGMRYCGPKYEYGRMQFRGASNMEELNELLDEHVMIRRLKSEVLHELPHQRQHIVPVPLSDWGKYAKATNQFAKWLESSPNWQRGRQAKRLVWWAKIRQLVAEQKMAAVFDWIANVMENTDDKLVVFAFHRETIRKLHERFPESVVINGAVIGSKREKAVKEFQSRARTRILFGNLQAAGVGLNLTAANKVAIVEFGWTPGDHSQAAARIDRIGQDQMTDCYFLMGVNTVEKVIIDIIMRKQTIADTVIDGREVKKLQLLDLLEEQIKKGHPTR